ISKRDWSSDVCSSDLGRISPQDTGLWNDAQNPVMRCQAAVWASFHSPVSWGLIRPSGETAVASVTTSPKPPAARAPRCTRCQSEIGRAEQREGGSQEG